MTPPTENGIAVEILERGLLLVSVNGEWDFSNSGDLAAAFDRIDNQNDLVLDLRKTEFFDSTCLSQVIHLHQRLLGAGRRMDVVATGIVKRLLTVAGVDGMLGIVPERLAQVDDLIVQRSSSTQTTQAVG